MTMTADDIARRLTESDKKILENLTTQLSPVKDITVNAGLDRSAALNSIRKLLGLGLINRVNEINLRYRLTALGKRYLDSGLPESVIFDFISKGKEVNYKQLNNLGLDENELSAGIGVLKRFGVFNQINGKISVSSEEADIVNKLQGLLREIETKGSTNLVDMTENLLKRKIIEREEIIAENASITKFGSQVSASPSFGSKLVDKLTSDVIKNWKDAAFREYDLNANIPLPLSGKKHVTKQLMSVIKEVLVSMGFAEMESNYAESAFWNFDVMMFKQNHPDRDIQDTVYINAGRAKVDSDILSRVKAVYENGFSRNKYDTSLGHRRDFDTEKSKAIIMRGHTTATTFRYISRYISKNRDKPAKYFSVSKVFRNETPDQTHLPEFYQIEGIVYDDGLTVADLIGYIKAFYGKIGINGIRVKPTYNPYTEPSLEIQAYSKRLGRWLEVGNSGVFRPETLEPFGINKNVIAWGFALERPLSLLIDSSDIRTLYGAFSDLDFLRNVELRRVTGSLI
jgi:phenylalanyl-tRNA synthetase alpha chain